MVVDRVVGGCPTFQRECTVCQHVLPFLQSPVCVPAQCVWLHSVCKCAHLCESLVCIPALASLHGDSCTLITPSCHNLSSSPSPVGFPFPSSFSSCFRKLYLTLWCLRYDNILKNLCSMLKTEARLHVHTHERLLCHCVSVDMKVLSVRCHLFLFWDTADILSITDSSPLTVFVHVSPLEIQAETTIFMYQTQISLKLVPDCSKVPLVQIGHISHLLVLQEHTVGPCCR